MSSKKLLYSFLSEFWGFSPHDDDISLISAVTSAYSDFPTVFPWIEALHIWIGSNTDFDVTLTFIITLTLGLNWYFHHNNLSRFKGGNIVWNWKINL